MTENVFRPFLCLREESMPSIVDVARHAGVSVATVSRVLSNSSHPVSSEAREQVLQAARELNYVPSALARALVTRETRIIGVIVGDAADPYFATIIGGVSDVAREQGYLTFICSSDRVPAVELNYVRLLRDYRADGVIFAGGGLTDPAYLEQMQEIVRWFRSHHVPVVALGHHLFDTPQVNIDNVAATRAMVEYLIQLGHRRIGYIAGPAGLTTTALRLKGYQQALAERGLPFDPALVVESDFTYEGGQRATQALLQVDPWPTAIFGSNDMVAIGALVALKERGIAVPQQISVVGFDNITATRYVDPPLTTVDVPMRELGATGMRQLLRAMDSDATVEPLHLLPHTLVIRDSATPPP